MRKVILLFLVVLGGCGGVGRRDCPTLPTPPAKADFNSMSDYATKVATLYGQCAGGMKP
jgi:uncharacterized protein YceK